MKSVPLTQELFDYIEKISVPDDPLCKELLAETLRLEIPMIQISTDQARFLYLLTKMINAKHALEIGTLAGYSGIHIARGLQPGGMLTTVDINPVSYTHLDVYKRQILMHILQIYRNPSAIQSRCSQLKDPC